MTKRALVVGINDYRNWRGAPPLTFPDLHWCAADAGAFATLLTTGLGFSTDDVILCEDSEATYQSILGGITVLLSQCQPGDVACFYFAGHGGRVPENGWGVPSSRYYEAIVPYDGAGMIFDHQLTEIAQTSQALGVNFTILLDCCHSGGLFPSDAVAAFRGFAWGDQATGDFISNCQTLIPLVGLDDPSLLDGNISNPARSANGVTLTVDPAKNFSDQAKALLICACNYNEAAGESTNFNHGYFTNAILETANQPNFTMGVTDLLAALQRKLNEYSPGRQTPQLRGRPPGQQETFLGSLSLLT